MRKSIVPAFLLCLLITGVAFAEPVAKITRIDGVASLLRKGAKDWRQIKPNTPLSIGDELYSEAETFIEIRYNSGAILRMDEKTKITIEESSEKTTKTRTGIGKIWVNMKKLTTHGTEFDVATPTATAAIRGTIYQMSTDQDSSTDVDVYDGKVAVGPSDQLKKQIQKENPQGGVDQPQEVPGPEEIPGPYEVPLETWMTIVAGQRISVRNDGKFAQGAFDMDAAGNKFIAKNKELDKALMKSQ
jgi:hypothetical protein